MAKNIPVAVQKERQVLELRRMGLTFDEVAARVGYANKGAAHKAYHRAIKRAGTSQLPTSERRALEVDRLERMHAALWPAAARGDLGAVRECARLSDRRVRLLGLAMAPIDGFDTDGEDGPDTSSNVVGQERLTALREKRNRGA